MEDQQLFVHIADLAKEVDVPANGILSRTLFNNERIKAVVFAFDKDQELSEHTASMPALLQFVSGEAELTLGSEPRGAEAGTFVYMQPELPHSVKAKTPVVMLLVLLKNQ